MQLNQTDLYVECSKSQHASNSEC